MTIKISPDDKKAIRFVEACKAWKASDKGAEALYKYSVEVWSCTLQGSGITFYDMQAIIKEYT